MYHLAKVDNRNIVISPTNSLMSRNKKLYTTSARCACGKWSDRTRNRAGPDPNRVLKTSRVRSGLRSSNMATGSLFAALVRGSRPRSLRISNLRASPIAFLESPRSFSSVLPKGDGFSVEEEPADPEDDLRSRVFRLRLPKRSATAALDRWVGEGRAVSASELRQIAKDLRRSQRYKHALEVHFLSTFSCLY